MRAAFVDAIDKHVNHLLLFIAQPIPGVFYRRFVVNVKGLVYVFLKHTAQIPKGTLLRLVLDRQGVSITEALQKLK